MFFFCFPVREPEGEDLVASVTCKWSQNWLSKTVLRGYVMGTIILLLVSLLPFLFLRGVDDTYCNQSRVLEQQAVRAGQGRVIVRLGL